MAVGDSSNLIGYLEAVVYGKRRGPAASIARCLLVVLSWVYRAALRLYLLPFETGVRRRKRLGRPVISVGNITLGGTGKTPTVQYICRGLMARGLDPAVLSYGYGGSLRGAFGVVADRSTVCLGPAEAGDEPVMLAASMPGVPVLVCKDRGRSGEVAVRDMGCDALVLDDGFQVWKLHRDLDIVLLNADSPFDNGRTLPAGRLREPAFALRRAHCIMVTGVRECASPKDVIADIGRVAPGAPVFFGRFRPSAIVSLDDGSEMDVESVWGKRVMALSSIANPLAFEEMLADAGIVMAATKRFPDHYLYTAEDVEQIGQQAICAGADLIVTTEKDAVKLQGRHADLPIVALRIELTLDDEAGFWRLVSDKTGHAGGPRQS
jgi:tetraacyldisaccharide 4'-kinase